MSKFLWHLKVFENVSVFASELEFGDMYDGLMNNNTTMGLGRYRYNIMEKRFVHSTQT